MYPQPLVNHGFNYQPIINLTQSNQFLHNQNKIYQENQIFLSSKSNSQIKNVSNSTTKTKKSSKKHSANLFPTHFSNQDQLTSRQSSLKRIPAKHSTRSHNSRSLSSLYDRIQKERKAHTMAPLAQISGPSSSPQAKMFATINPPTDNQINRSNHSQISNQKSDIEMTDDDGPIIVKVRYDPQTGLRPSEDSVRQALDNQIFDRKTEKNPIVLHFFGQNSQLQLSNRIQQNSFPSGIPLQSSRTSLSMPHPFLYDKNIRPVQPPKPFIKHQQIQSLQIPRLPNRNISSLSTNEFDRTGFNTIKPNHLEMANQQSSTTINNQQNLSRRPNIVPSSTEVFRPPEVKDIPELSKENLLNMLNQIPDLQGRRFNIEYAPPTAPEGYPIPSNIDSANNTYPEPVVIDKLPTNIIQHVKNSNNPALTAALEATIRQEQNFQSQSTISTLNVQPPTVMHHAAQPYRQVQQSRSVSSNDSDSSTKISSSETSSSEESDCEELTGVSPTKPANNIPFIGPIPPRSNQYR